MQLQRRRDGAWRTLRNTSRFVNENGVVTWHEVWRRRGVLDLRAFTHEVRGERLSKSGAVTVRVRRGG